jgi:hypothetical protein
MYLFIMITGFWFVMPCSLVDGTNVSELPALSIFYPEAGGSRFLPNIDTYPPK